MKFIQQKNKGFTLVELLVVIAIIGLLSSIALSSLNTARNKAKDTAIKADVANLVTLANLNFNEYGNYCNLQGGWVTGISCSTAYANGIYASNAQGICNDILKNINTVSVNTLYSGTVAGCATKYSFIVRLNNGNHWWCSGSSGIKAEYAAYWNPANQPGCWENP